jgi:hypothetical protein
MEWSFAFTHAATPSFHDCTIFSKIYLVKGYHQIPVPEENIPKTAIITPFDLFQYLFTSFGLSNAAQTFQRMMYHTIDGLEGVFAHMDDSRGGFPDCQMHLIYLEHFLQLWQTMVLPSTLKSVFFCSPNFGTSWSHDFSDRLGPHTMDPST